MSQRKNILDQIKSFQKNRDQFEPRYRKLSSQKGKNVDKFLMPFWDGFNKELETILLPYPSFNFFRNPIIANTMFVTAGGDWMKQQIKFLEKHWPYGKLNEVLLEDWVGRPKLTSKRYLTSHNTIHHLYHMARYFDETGVKPTELKTVVEWGGGYGNMAKLFHRLSGGDQTYVIIDTPLFSTIQWLYLSSVLGSNKVVLIGSDERSPQVVEGKINLVTLANLNCLDKIKADLFVSTWGLSESSDFSQDYVLDHNWFGAKRLLIGYQESTKELAHASRLGELAKAAGAKLHDTDYIEHNFYAFK